MRWPFGPPHLTLKPSKKNKTTKNKKKQNKKQQKKPKNKKNQARKCKKHKNTKKIAFQLSVKIFFFWQGIQKLPFLTPWPRKRAPKNTIKIRVSAYFLGEKSYASRNGHFWTKKTQILKFQLSFFFLPFFLFQKQKKHQNLLKPLFRLFL